MILVTGEVLRVVNTWQKTPVEYLCESIQLGVFSFRRVVQFLK